MVDVQADYEPSSPFTATVSASLHVTTQATSHRNSIFMRFGVLRHSLGGFKSVTPNVMQVAGS